ncbi:MAG: hypothetical protein XD63_1475 [Thermoanaerobacterales bacterium 50_218]|nr:MAG: hypothetical protein XD63_1475 [Thermoanaerobacterales bacterium 50_218]
MPLHAATRKQHEKEMTKLIRVAAEEFLKTLRIDDVDQQVTVAKLGVSPHMRHKGNSSNKSRKGHNVLFRSQAVLR